MAVTLLGPAAASSTHRPHASREPRHRKEGSFHRNPLRNSSATECGEVDKLKLRLTEHTLSFIDSFRDARGNVSASSTRKAKSPQYVERLELEWVATLCPDVVQHYRRVPLFSRASQGVPAVLTSAAAMTQTCLLRVVDAAARRAGAQWFLYAGGHLGAVLHGGPIPWDDDVDVLVDIAKLNEFTESLTSFELPGASFSVVQTNHTLHGEMKLSVVGNPPVQNFPSRSLRRKHVSVPPLTWPYVDIFFYNKNSTHLFEVDMEFVPMHARNGGGVHRLKNLAPNTRGGPVWNLTTFFPSRTYMYGGLTLPGPSLEVARRRYKLDICKSNGVSHRLNVPAEKLPKQFQFGTRNLDCCRLRRHLPFVRRFGRAEELVIGDRVIHTSQLSPDGQMASRFYVDANGARLFMSTHIDPWSNLTLDLPDLAWDTSTTMATWPVTADQREAWRAISNSSRAADLSAQIPQLNATEIDNAIAPHAACPELGEALNNRSLRVLQFNAERGRNWFALALMLRAMPALGADLLLLNEMDIGMARSGNVHTTRMLAYATGYNYAWGLEFVELTRGTHAEQQATVGERDTFGLHGNAILSRCPLRNAQIVRDSPNKLYFSDTPNAVNAKGSEKRLGGRMGLVAEVGLAPAGAPSRLLMAASVHKLSGMPKIHQLSELLRTGRGGPRRSSGRSRRDVVLAGDLAGTYKFCSRVGLGVHGVASSGGFPASCDTQGGRKGDYFCSNLVEARAEETHRPCYRQWRQGTVLSDHAITTLVVKLS